MSHSGCSPKCEQGISKTISAWLSYQADAMLCVRRHNLQLCMYPMTMAAICILFGPCVLAWVTYRLQMDNCNSALAPVLLFIYRLQNRNSSASLVTRLQFGPPDNRRFISGSDSYYSPLHNIKTSRGAHSVSYPVGNRGSFPRSNAVVT